MRGVPEKSVLALQPAVITSSSAWIKILGAYQKAAAELSVLHEYPFPHCDSRVLHAPTVCEFCDGYKDYQDLRLSLHVNFTGQYNQMMAPCPADLDRGDSHQLWIGNRSSSWTTDKDGDPVCTTEDDLV